MKIVIQDIDQLKAIFEHNCVKAFVQESNKIEGYDRVLDEELQAHHDFLAQDNLSVRDIQEFVHRICGAQLRERFGMDVSVGDHSAPAAGPDIRTRLNELLIKLNFDSDKFSPWFIHTQYETLHPFEDGNGRSGRVLWAWHMKKIGFNPFRRPFLHEFYYQSLIASRLPK